MIEIDWHPDARKLRTFAGLLAAVSAMALARLAWSVPAAWQSGLAVVGVVVGVVGLVRPRWMRPVYVGWMAALYPVGWIVSHALLAAVYYGLVTPIGLILRACGRDPLRRRFDRAAPSYWQPRPPEPAPERYFRQF
jgi:hypothetical protein